MAMLDGSSGPTKNKNGHKKRCVRFPSYAASFSIDLRFLLIKYGSPAGRFVADASLSHRPTPVFANSFLLAIHAYFAVYFLIAGRISFPIISIFFINLSNGTPPKSICAINRCML